MARSGAVLVLSVCAVVLATGCLPTRKDNVAPEPAVTVEDGGADALASDATAATDATPGDGAPTDTKGKDVAVAKGCAKNLDCDGFSTACARAECDVGSGSCKLVPLAEGATCTDADACSTAVCTAGACNRTAIDCGDGNACTTDSCGLTTGCAHVPTAGTCDDGDACTENDKCVDGECSTGSAKNCDDADGCTVDSCDKTLGCIHAPPPPGTPCDDGHKCTTQDTCKGKQCQGKQIDCPDDGNPCTIEGCSDKSTGQCESNVVDGGGAAVVCDDKNPCTKADVCSGTTCAGSPDDCDDKNPCTDDVCEPGKGCAHGPNLDNCTKDACSQPGSCLQGVCVASILSCDDGNACSQDGCDLAKGCTYTLVDGECGDGDACTVGDTCVAGACKAGPKDPCDDGDACTTDSCDPVKGCVHAQASPGSACGSAKVCVAGQCIGDVCGDGLCGYGETTTSCLADCPVSGGDCTASDASCITGCRQKKCSSPDASCSAENGCAALTNCLGACQGFSCEQGCFVATPAASVALFLSDNACVQAFCVADSWLGRKCQAGQEGYVPCVDACTSAMCPLQDVACQADVKCAAVLACVNKCASGDQACVDACGAKTNALFDARVLCAQTYCQ
jgi:hypothetical protein